VLVLTTQLTILLRNFWSHLNEAEQYALDTRDMTDFIHHCDVILYSVRLLSLLFSHFLPPHLRVLTFPLHATFSGHHQNYSA